MGRKDVEQGKRLGRLELEEELMDWRPNEHPKRCPCEACRILVTISARMATELTLAGIIEPPPQT